MLTIVIPKTERWDQVHNEFIYSKESTITLEHSLVSISKWESKWKKPWLSRDSKTIEEFIDYVKCMTITQNVKPEVYYNLSPDNIKEIDEYINDSMTATTFSDKSHGGREIITSEIIYYWMISLNIPFECQKWHLNRLLTLVHVCSIKEAGDQKKMSKNEIMSRNRALNAQRRAKAHSKG
jgi:hypothetical protein